MNDTFDNQDILDAALASSENDVARSMAARLEEPNDIAHAILDPSGVRLAKDDVVEAAPPTLDQWSGGAPTPLADLDSIPSKDELLRALEAGSDDFVAQHGSTDIENPLGLLAPLGTELLQQQQRGHEDEDEPVFAGLGDPASDERLACPAGHDQLGAFVRLECLERVGDGGGLVWLPGVGRFDDALGLAADGV